MNGLEAVDGRIRDFERIVRVGSAIGGRPVATDTVALAKRATVSCGGVTLTDYVREHAAPLYQAFAADSQDIRAFVPLMHDVDSDRALHEAHRGLGRRAASILENGRPVGAIVSKRTYDDKVHVCGSWLGAAYRGRGIMSAAREAFNERAFTVEHAGAVKSDVDAVNLANRRVLERLGAEITATYHDDAAGRFCGPESAVKTTYTYELSAADWHKRRAAR